MLPVIVAGLILGGLSSFHCVGMCGPLAFSLPVTHMPRHRQILSVTVYNSGRMLTYVLLGLIFGYAGRNLQLAGLQQTFSITTGIIMLVLALLYFSNNYTAQPKMINLLQRGINNVMSYALQLKSVRGFGLLGLANGLLPCGMVYLALAGAVNTGSVENSMLFMGMFGLGTFPAMMVIGLVGFRLKLSLRQKIRNLVPYVMSVMGILLVLRGMNLGIPFISPVLFNGTPDPVICH